MPDYKLVLSEIRDNLNNINESLITIAKIVEKLPIELIANADKISINSPDLTTSKISDH